MSYFGRVPFILHFDPYLQRYSPSGAFPIFSAVHTRAPLASNSVTLAWDASTGTNAIAEYHVHYGVASGSYTNVVSAGNMTSTTISNLVPGTTYYFAVTATDTNNMTSQYSNEASEPVVSVPLPPGSLTITITVK